jgi:hypothetical protein
MKQETYQQTLDRLNGVDTWLVGMGLSKPADRIRLHIANIRKLEEARENGTLGALVEDKGAVQLVWSRAEATEFAEIYSVLRYQDPQLFKDQLERALKGPLDPTQERTSSASNIGRNTMFELNLACRLLAKNVPVQLPVNPDILCEVDKRKVFIQCKRPFHENKIPRNMSTARKQLQRDFKKYNDSRARGIIAISVSRAVNSGDNLFLAKNERAMGNLAGEVRKLREHCRRQWQDIVDPRIIAILFHIITPAFVEDAELLVVAQQTCIQSLALPGSSDDTFARDFGSLVEGDVNDTLQSKTNVDESGLSSAGTRILTI